MQVASAAELSTSATLGGGKTIDFGISNDPAFFQILSANLYSNQKLAVVRETLCNLWDAHIDAGITDKKGLVTINDSELVFRDYGKGIHPDLMGQVYGTYGASTKKNDSKSTGGFGLGCKSPFAYTDSFRVTSHHNGTKTVYNITKSSVESGGKPGITEIMQAPTDESGLEVRIPIDRNDVWEFINYIKYIVCHGEMKIELVARGYYDHASDRLLSTMGMSFESGSYDINDNLWYDDYMGDHTVFIRYGNVIYPALDTPATRPAIDTIKRFMRILHIQRIVVQAAPDTLALTPSREALSSQKMTENGIVDLCLDLTKQIEKDIRSQLPRQINKAAASLSKLSTGRLNEDCWQDWTNRLPELSRLFLESSLGKDLKKHWTPFMRNAEMAAYKREFGNSPFLLQILKAVHVAKTTENKEAYRKLHWQFVAKRLASVFKAKELNMGCFRSAIFCPYRFIANRDHLLFRTQTDLRALVYSMEKKVVFITTRLRDVEYSCEAWPGFGERTHNRNYFIYHIGKKKDENLVPVDLFTKAGWEVIDLTLQHEWDPNVKQKKARAVTPKQEKEKAVNGLVPLRNIWAEGDKGVHVFVKSQVKDKTSWKGEVESPIFYVGYDEVKYDQLGRYCTRAMVTDEILDNAVIVRNGIELNMAKRRGAVHVDEYFIKPLLATMLSKEMKEYITRRRNPDLSNHHNISSEVLKMVKALDINLPGLKKLGYRKDLEAVLDVLSADSLYRLNLSDIITDEEYEAAVAVTRYHLQEYSWIKQLKAVMRDTVIRKLNIEYIRESLVDNPERKAAFRSLVLIAMKNGTKQ